ncbi:RecQ family ATP-dependent DNA helicase [Paraconexibacter antarcticus]|uniref:DNA 3'-5' helicase n=1 Tax=Paraconexibacter antarcticus TaxID=2949664 RepID=A0ABY5DUP9_9ACTN|nr:RecQ family ATP-dependent DNA helicase [Paraconexibacter antarcticus]UTI65736.1 RecQ family ATP-dependent DNA helicase [Paraconexibacter antarcticus]
MPASPDILDIDAAAAAHLHALAGPDAVFREGQLEAIRDLVADRARVLCVQRTGWGKSAVYFVATALLRSDPTHPSGPTLIVSPLLALMRNQIAAAERLGIRARTINSTNVGEWRDVQEALARDEVDLLLISPERLNHPRFRDEMLPLFAQAIGLLVVDEAHCVSDWGHDFRPDYRRIRDMIGRLPAGVAVLGTTATANDRVVADVTEQLAAGDERALRVYRGPLGRSSLRLEVCELPSQAARLAWLVQVLPTLEGSGIVYTLTKRDADQVAAFLSEHGVPAAAYSGDQPSDERIVIEDRLLRDDLKAVVATSALGMGYDKADLRFVVHFQAPGSVIAYYQQVGRAGRGVEHADVVLLRGREDRRIQDFFIEQAFPRREHVDRVLEALSSGDGATVPQLQSLVNLGRGRLEAMLKILEVEGAVAKDGTRWRTTGADWVYDAERYAQITALRRAEQAAMAALGADGRCLMRALQEELDDPDPADCGRCSVCTAPRYDVEPDPALVAAATRTLRSRPLTLDPKKMAPDRETGAMKKLPVDVLVEEGRALARAGDDGWDPLIRAGLDGGRVSDELVQALADLVRDWRPDVGWVAAVPSRREGDPVSDVAARVAAALGLPFAPVVSRADPARPPQSRMRNAAQQAENVRGAFAVGGDVPAGGCLLVDDLRQSGWTLAMVGGQLRRRGAPAVYPLALRSSF